jgi:predicted small secreted protein
MKIRGGTIRRRGVRRALAALVLIVLVGAAGCATMRGVGEDIQALGRGIKRVFTPSE